MLSSRQLRSNAERNGAQVLLEDDLRFGLLIGVCVVGGAFASISINQMPQETAYQCQ
jgi:hypothetical protein